MGSNLDTRQITVLIVDDQPNTIQSLTMMLQLADDIHPVAYARTGVEALDLARIHRPDVVLIDVQMPEVDGISASINIMRALPGTQVIMMSTLPDTDYQWGAMLVGASDFLTKPFTSTQLLNAIYTAAKRGVM